MRLKRALQSSCQLLSCSALGNEIWFLWECFAEKGTLLVAGLLGSNWLFLLDMAKKNVLQASATVIPAAATMYCMGVEARTERIAGFDFSSFNKYRSAMTPAVHEQHR